MESRQPNPKPPTKLGAILAPVGQWFNYRLTERVSAGMAWLLILLATLVVLVSAYTHTTLVAKDEPAGEQSVVAAPEAPAQPQYTKEELLEIMNTPLATPATDPVPRDELEAIMNTPLATRVPAAHSAEGLQATLETPLVRPQ